MSRAVQQASAEAWDLFLKDLDGVSSSVGLEYIGGLVLTQIYRPDRAIADD